MYSDQEFKREVIEKLDTLIKLVAISNSAQTLLGGKSQKEQIKFLSDLGLSRNIIALIVGTTPLTVSVTLSKMKEKKKEAKLTESKEEEKVEHE